MSTEQLCNYIENKNALDKQQEKLKRDSQNSGTNFDHIEDFPSMYNIDIKAIGQNRAMREAQNAKSSNGNG